MKKLIVKKFNQPVIELSHLKDIFQKENIPLQSLDQINWPKEFPYLPQVNFAIAHNNDAIFIHFEVNEMHTLAKRTVDGEDVWKDSCAEFFIQFPSDTGYYNLETNCIGTCLMAYGEGRANRTPISTKEIQRVSSLKKETFQSPAECSWQLNLKIPIDVFIKTSISSLSGITARANVYKCGDEMQNVHFVSWNKIETEHPDFHQPKYFGAIEFE